MWTGVELLEWVSTNGKLPEALAHRIFIQLVAGSMSCLCFGGLLYRGQFAASLFAFSVLKYIHSKQLPHCDLSLENVMIIPSTGEIKVCELVLK